MKKTNYLAIVLLLILSFSFVEANEDSVWVPTTSTTSVDESLLENDDKMKEDRPMIRTNVWIREKITMSGSIMKDKMSWIKEDMKTFRKDIKEVRNEKREIISNNLRDLKENRSEIKSEFSLRSVLKWLNSELTDEIKALDETFRADMKALEEELKANIWDIEKVKELRLRIQNIRIAYNEKLISLVTDTEVKNTLTKRLELLKQNFELINSNIGARIEFRWKLNNKVSTYKDKLSTKLEKGLPKVKETNIEKVLWKLDWVISTIENNTKITQINKDTIMAQLIALKELLEEQIEANTTVELDILAE